MGIAIVAKEAYHDPTSADPAWFAIDVKPLKKLSKPVSLEQIKKEKKLAGMALVRISRLSVQPVTNEEWQINPENGRNGFSIMKIKIHIFFFLLLVIFMLMLPMPSWYHRIHP